MLRVLAVDDEEPALDDLVHLLRQDPRIHSVEGVRDATAALRRLGRAIDDGPGGAEAIDAVFLDIHMPVLSGVDIARLLSGFVTPPQIVFVTAHEGYAVQAFEMKAVDYLLKPLRKERLAEAVRRVAAKAGSTRRAGPGAPLGALLPEEPPLDSRPAASPSEVRTESELAAATRLLGASNITYAEARGDYTRLSTSDGTCLSIRVPLSALEDRWRDWGFVRIHRSYLVSLDKVEELRTDGVSMSVRLGAVSLPVSRRNGRELRELLLRRFDAPTGGGFG
ncbi:LytR/AlgR family response regulator transcription factor [Streptomyces sp. NPDC058548]|uniref:LytR/AlgR family response regulator transcription factor n=1 Tax=unclassified Streptomyces TaxID=2593676 RepID=UPI00365BB445